MLLFVCTEVTSQCHQSIPSLILNLAVSLTWSYSYTSTFESSDVPSAQDLVQKKLPESCSWEGARVSSAWWELQWGWELRKTFS